MKKCRLDLDALEVESFSTTTDPRRAGGTVFAATGVFSCNVTCNKCTGGYYSCNAQCDTVNTADVNGTCDFVCYGDGGGDSAHSACLDCFTNLDTCTIVDGCHYASQDGTCDGC